MAYRLGANSSETGQRETMHYLSILNLSPADFDALRLQGFVSREIRHGRICFRLRFRRHGRQVAIGLGAELWLAERIGEELAELQVNRRLALQQARLIQAARRLLRRSKRALEPALRNAGYRFHGYEIRRPRDPERLR